jgi:hypothetical protein
MRNAVFVVLVLCAAISPAATLHAADTKDCALTRYASLDLIGDPSRQLVAPVTIQDSQAYIVLSTSDAYSSLTESTVRRFSLQTRSVPIRMQVFKGGRIRQL